MKKTILITSTIIFLLANATLANPLIEAISSGSLNEDNIVDIVIELPDEERESSMENAIIFAIKNSQNEDLIRALLNLLESSNRDFLSKCLQTSLEMKNISVFKMLVYEFRALFGSHPLDYLVEFDDSQLLAEYIGQESIYYNMNSAYHSNNSPLARAVDFLRTSSSRNNNEEEQQCAAMATHSEDCTSTSSTAALSEDATDRDSAQSFENSNELEQSPSTLRRSPTIVTRLSLLSFARNNDFARNFPENIGSAFGFYSDRSN